jgi:hypothetical protein
MLHGVLPNLRDVNARDGSCIPSNGLFEKGGGG